MTVLLYRTLGLGDFLTAVPAYRAVARAFTGQEVCLAAPGPLRPLAELCGVVDRFVPTGELQVPDLGGRPPDVAVNLHGKGPQSHRTLLALRPGRLIAFAEPSTGVAGPSWRPDEHEVARWCRLLESAGIPADAGDLDLATPAAPPPVRGATVLHPGAADPARRWPAARFAEVGAALRRAGHDVVVTGVAAERPLAEAVAREAGIGPDRVLAGRLDLGELAALVSAARLVVCGDTGVAHLATAYRTPSVLLFGPMPPALWGPPPGRDEHRVLWPERLAAADGAVPGGPHPALLAITVDEVLAAAAQLLP